MFLLFKRSKLGKSLKFFVGGGRKILAFASVNHSIEEGDAFFTRFVYFYDTKGRESIEKDIEYNLLLSLRTKLMVSPYREWIGGIKSIIRQQETGRT